MGPELAGQLEPGATGKDTGCTPHDVAALTGLLGELRDKGNTVLVVETDPNAVRRADHVIDLGPGAGADGGELLDAGDVAGLAAAATSTAAHLGRRPELATTLRHPTGTLQINGATMPTTCSPTSRASSRCWRGRSTSAWRPDARAAADHALRRRAAAADAGREECQRNEYQHRRAARAGPGLRLRRRPPGCTRRTWRG